MEERVPHATEHPDLKRGIGPYLLLFFVLGDIVGAGIYAVEKYPDYLQREPRVRLLEECTDLFVKYEQQRQISRIYVPREELDRARAVLSLIGTG